MKVRRLISSALLHSQVEFSYTSEQKSSLLKFEENKVNMRLGNAEYGFDAGSEVHAVLITSCSSLPAVMW